MIKLQTSRAGMTLNAWRAYLSHLAEKKIDPWQVNDSPRPNLLEAESDWNLSLFIGVVFLHFPELPDKIHRWDWDQEEQPVLCNGNLKQPK